MKQFLTIIALFLLSQSFLFSQEIAPPRTELTFKIGLGRMWLDMDALNESLDHQGFQTYTNAYKYKPASIEVSLRVHKNIFGFEFASHDNLNSDLIKNDFQNNITFFNLKMNYARAFFLAENTYIFPKIGIGFGELHNVFQPYEPNGVEYSDLTTNQRSSTHLVTNGFVLDFGIGGHQNFYFNPKNNDQMGGVNLGFNVGYSYEFSKSANKDGWVQHGQLVHNGPDLNMTGWYLKLIFGAVYGHR